ncbi:MAG: hypothetical protein ACFFAO_19935 [Candidatus Hermodarchaeota archaeon]
MIYKTFLIDGDNGVSLLELTFKEFRKENLLDNVIAGFFNAVNNMIDNIQEAMAKGRRINEMTRILESEESTIIIYYHPLSRVLFCSILDADDDIDKTKRFMNKIGNRFWKKHQSDLKIYRATTEKLRFETFKADIENLSMGGKIAEVFPKAQIMKSVLEKIFSMGMINEFELRVALKCNGKNSPLKISRDLETARNNIHDALKKLEELDIIKL